MKLQLFLTSALTFDFALAGDEVSNTMHRELNKEGTKNRPFASRDLRSVGNRNSVVGNRMRKAGKGGKYGKSTKNEPGPGSGPKSTKSTKKGPSSGPKSGKSSREHTYTYYVAPIACTNMCIDADGADMRTGELTNAVQSCSTNGMHGNTQQWILDENDDIIQVESYAYKGKCIGVDYEPGDKSSEVIQSCTNGILALLPCDNPATYWYFTGDELVSFFCWSKGVSTAMSVSYDQDEEKCRNELKANGAGSGNENTTPIREFMFVSSDDMELLYNPS